MLLAAAGTDDCSLSNKHTYAYREVKGDCSNAVLQYLWLSILWESASWLKPGNKWSLKAVLCSASAV